MLLPGGAVARHSSIAPTVMLLLPPAPGSEYELPAGTMSRLIDGFWTASEVSRPESINATPTPIASTERPAATILRTMSTGRESRVASVRFIVAASYHVAGLGPVPGGAAAGEPPEHGALYAHRTACQGTHRSDISLLPVENICSIIRTGS